MAFAQPAAPPHFERGVQLERAGDFAGARAAYEQALAIAPGRVDALSNLGAVWLRLGRASEAAASFRKALATRPDLIQVRFFLGLALYQSGQFAGARTELGKVLAAQPGEARALHLDALCLLKLDRLDEGVRLLERVLAAPGAPNTQAAVTLATAYISLGELDKAEALLAGRSSPAVQLAQGALLNARNRHREAEGVLVAAREADPQLPSVHNQLGYTRMLLGDYVAAVEDFEKELAIAPKDFQATANLGWIHVQERNYEKALGFLVEAQRQKPDNAGLSYLMGQVRSSRNEWAAAATSLEAAVRKQPEFRAAHVLLARVYARLNRLADLAREQALIARLNEAEQVRSAASGEGYGVATQRPPP